MERIETLLIDELREGDMAALAILVEKYKRLVYRVAVQITKNHEDANDVMQDTFLKVYESIHSFRKDAAFETWLYRIVVNHATSTMLRTLSNAGNAVVNPHFQALVRWRFIRI